jgi:hypothetical protein
VPFYLISLINFHRFLLACGSSPVVGSSRNIIAGLFTSVVAIENLCFCPPDNSLL